MYAICVSTQIPEYPTDEQVAQASSTLKLLADPTRLRVLWALLHGEHAVNELADHVGAQPAGVSQHLAKLRLAGLVNARREGNRIFYAATTEHLRRLVEEALFHADHIVQGLPDHGAPAQAQGAKRKRA